jgi:hypothetical protein
MSQSGGGGQVREANIRGHIYEVSSQAAGSLADQKGE